ncbi:MAG: hypothetical protein KAS71_08215 [Bacteroidales bacterium]|nr:hypothetical protein [Bacteroidales bacterium]
MKIRLLSFFLIFSAQVWSQEPDCIGTSEDKRQFNELINSDWELVFSDDCTQEWTEKWILDGNVGHVENSNKRMSIHADPEINNNAHLWTKKSFTGDLLIEYDYRLDTCDAQVNIIQAQDKQPAFPGAEGYGMYATGGRGGDIDSVTIQWCMITESLKNSHHHKGSHGYGEIIGALRQTVHHNLYVHHSSRSPKISGRRHCKVDFRNNVIYNWGLNNCYDGAKSHINWVNNYYKAGPGTATRVRDRIFNLSDALVDPVNAGWEKSNTYKTSLYAEGNYVDGFPGITEDNWSGGIDFTEGANEENNRAYTAFDFPAITEQTAKETYPIVVANAGASLVRDAIDKRIANEVLTGTTTYKGSISGTPGIIDSQNDVGGLPELSTLSAPKDKDQDGMPDDWEKKNGLNPKDPKDGNEDKDGDGFTNLEEYMNSIVSY